MKTGLIREFLIMGSNKVQTVNFRNRRNRGIKLIFEYYQRCH